MDTHQIGEDDTAGGLSPDPDHRLPAAEETGGLTFPLDSAPAAGEAREIAPGILMLRMPLPWSLDHINLYVLEDGEGWTIVDTGICSRCSKACWEAALAGPLGGRPVRRVLVTHHHPDHIGLAAWFGVPILATRSAWLTARTLSLDVGEEPPAEVLAFSCRAGLTPEMVEKQRQAGWGNYARLVAPLPVGYRRIDGGESLRIGDDDWRVIETAGHAPGHASLYCAPRQLLISGDQVLPLISSNVSVHPTEPRGNPLAEWLEGLARMQALPESTLVLPAHNLPFHGLIARLDALIDKHVVRMGALAAVCAEAPRSAVEVFPALFRRRVSSMEFLMATGEALAHLHYLEALGILAREERDGVARFCTLRPYDEAAVRAALGKITRGAKERGPWRA